VLRTRPDFLGASRAPLQLGAELFGVAGTQGDTEIVELLIEVLKVTGLDELHVDLGHMGIFQQLADAASLAADDRQRLHAALVARARQDVDTLCDSLQIEQPLRELFVLIADSSGDVEGLGALRERFASAPQPVLAAYDNLLDIARLLRQRLGGTRLYYDLAALKGQSYHNGLVFSVYTPGSGRAVASGGRYDDIGIAFGRGRPATGFSLDLRMLSRIAGNKAVAQPSRLICAPHEADSGLQDKVRQLRAQGERVVFCYDGELPDADDASIARLVKKDGNWVVD
jgi:ATP phosphoribosyltransferase regulatory subunit